MKKIGLALTGLMVLSSGFAVSADAAKYNDAHYKSQTLAADQGYVAGQKLWNGDKVYSLEIATPEGFDVLAKKSDAVKFNNAQNKALNNKLVVYKFEDNSLMKTTLKLNSGTQKAFNSGKIFSLKKYNDYMLQFVNKDRKSKGIAPIKYTKTYQSGTDKRSVELAGYGDVVVKGKAHVRLNGSSYKTAFSKKLQPSIVGENTALLFYDKNPYEIVSEKYMAQRVFTQLKSSKLHYGNMMNPKAKVMTSGIKVGEEYAFGVKGRTNGIVSVQIFAKK